MQSSSNKSEHDREAFLQRPDMGARMEDLNDRHGREAVVAITDYLRLQRAPNGQRLAADDCEALNHRCNSAAMESTMQSHHIGNRTVNPAWNLGRSLGPKRALKPQQVWEIRFHLEQAKRVRDRAMFDIAIDSKLRGCDVVKLRIGDVAAGGETRRRSTVVQQKTGRPVSFEMGDIARASLTAWLIMREGRP